MRAIACLLLSVCLFVAGCVDVDFVEGVRCSSDRQCGRSLSCDQGFCGGCPEPGLLPNGSCGCPGDRIFDCRVLPSAPFCMPMCPRLRDRCALAVVLANGERLDVVACEDADPGAPCFTVEPGSMLCAAGEDELRVDAPMLDFTSVVANCPPPDDERFDCEPP